jgi:hypothetical protein
VPALRRLCDFAQYLNHLDDYGKPFERRGKDMPPVIRDKRASWQALGGSADGASRSS